MTDSTREKHREWERLQLQLSDLLPSNAATTPDTPALSNIDQCSRSPDARPRSTASAPSLEDIVGQAFDAEITFMQHHSPLLRRSSIAHLNAQKSQQTVAPSSSSTAEVQASSRLPDEGDFHSTDQPRTSISTISPSMQRSAEPSQGIGIDATQRRDRGTPELDTEETPRVTHRASSPTPNRAMTTSLDVKNEASENAAFVDQSRTSPSRQAAATDSAFATLPPGAAPSATVGSFDSEEMVQLPRSSPPSVDVAPSVVPSAPLAVAESPEGLGKTQSGAHRPPAPTSVVSSEALHIQKSSRGTVSVLPQCSDSKSRTLDAAECSESRAPVVGETCQTNHQQTLPPAPTSAKSIQQPLPVRKSTPDTASVSSQLSDSKGKAMRVDELQIGLPSPKSHRPAKAQVGAADDGFVDNDEEMAIVEDDVRFLPKRFAAVDKVLRLRCPDTGDPDEAIPTDEVLFSTFREFSKRRNFQLFPIFTVFFISLCFIAFANFVDWNSTTAKYYAQLGVRRVMAVESFEKISSWEDVRVWLRSAAGSVAGASPENLPLTTVVIRQLRRTREPCTGASVFQTLSFLGSGWCVSSSFSTATYPALSQANGSDNTGTAQFFANEHSPWPIVDAPDVPGTRWGMREAKAQFEVHIPIVVSAGVPDVSTVDSTKQSSDSSDAANTTVLPYVRRVTPAEAAAAVDKLWAAGYVDESTVSICVDVVFYHAPLSRFTYISSLVEAMPSGLVVPAQRTHVFDAPALGTGDDQAVAAIKFCFDLLVLAFAAFLLYDAGTLVWLRYKSTRSVQRAVAELQLWAGLALAGLLVAYTVTRLSMWGWTGTMDPDPVPSAATHPRFYPRTVNTSDVPVTPAPLATATGFDGTFVPGGRLSAAECGSVQALLEVSAISMVAERIIALAMIPAMAKFVLYFRDVQGLNVVQATILHSLDELVVIFMVGIGVLCFFSIAANVFFGSTSENFVTLTRAVGTLVRLVVSTDPGPVDGLLESHPRSASLFFAMFFLVQWLLILNLVLGSIVASVAQVMQSDDDPAARRHGSLETLVGVVKRYVFFQSSDYRAGHDLVSPGGAVATTDGSLRVMLPWTQRRGVMTRTLDLYFRAVIALERFAKGRLVVSRREFMKLLDFLPARERAKLFDEVLQQHKSIAVHEQAESKAELVQQELIGLVEDVAALETAVFGDPEAEGRMLADRADRKGSFTSSSPAMSFRGLPRSSRFLLKNTKQRPRLGF